jgi:molybdenum cofactor guanylyltransferase
MGEPKAALEWHGSTLLRRTTGIVARAVDGPVLVVSAPGQPLPDLPDEVRIVEDPEEGLGPLQGLAVGLAAAAPFAELAFVCSTDLPFLHTCFVRRVLAAFSEGVDVVVPHARGHRQPLAAGYRTSLAPVVARLLSEGARKPAMLFEVCATRWLDEGSLLLDPALAHADPTLESVLNINDRDDYTAARSRPAPSVTVQRYGALARDGRSGPRPVRAATLAAAAQASDLVLDRHVVAALNGERITRDGHTPLTTGDHVSFLTADAGG